MKIKRAACGPPVLFEPFFREALMNPIGSLRAPQGGNPECQQYQKTLDRHVTSFLAMTE